jgi:hypothetical protein
MLFVTAFVELQTGACAELPPDQVAVEVSAVTAGLRSYVD